MASMSQPAYSEWRMKRSNFPGKNETSLAGDSASPATPDQTRPPQRILVVDDNVDTRQLTLDVLASSGYEAEGAADGAPGWEALQTFDYDLVVTDNRMPRMTGVEMIAKLRAARMSLPVIMATGVPPKYEFERRPWLKPDLLLERPFTNDDLVEAVRKILDPAEGGYGQETSPALKPPQ